MSMNLAARSSKGPLNLWQLTTQASYTILPRKSGKVTGAAAIQALERYMEWVRYSTNGVWNSPEDLEWAEQNVKSHLSEISKRLEDKDLSVWVE